MKKKKELPKEYFVEALKLISLTALDYDGHNPRSAASMRRLVDNLASQANSALNGKPLYRDANGDPVWSALFACSLRKIYPKRYQDAAR